jgi:aerobic-type carbon monoxide dehydrogenase small subunit (CoxS/CutS family)
MSAPTAKMKITVNGTVHLTDASPTMRLLDFLRDELDLTGAKEGCGGGECGACTVLVDGAPICSCLMVLGSAAEREVTTVEGLGNGAGGLDPLQQAFVDEGAVQCGYCTPGLVMSARALVDSGRELTDEVVRTGLAGNICRCTGYKKVVDAVQKVGAATADVAPVAAAASAPRKEQS